MKQHRLLSYTNKLITMNYQQFLLYSERKVIIYRKLMIQCFMSIMQLIYVYYANCQIHQDMKLIAGL